LKNKLREIFTRKKKKFLNRDEQITYKMDKIVTSLKMSKEGNIWLAKSFENNLLECYCRRDNGEIELLEYISIFIKINEENP
jgi:hypothetical protein